MGGTAWGRVIGLGPGGSTRLASAAGRDVFAERSGDGRTLWLVAALDGGREVTLSEMPFPGPDRRERPDADRYEAHEADRRPA